MVTTHAQGNPARSAAFGRPRKPFAALTPAGRESRIRSAAYIGSRHGIIETPGRQQPYAIWEKGEVLRFCATREDAELFVLLREEVTWG